jgi:peptidoglycan/xylan/chitin deacetylase (PgdA/CDA1 family)
MSAADAARAARRQQMSEARRRGLRRLGLLVGGLVVLIVLAVLVFGGGGDGGAKNGIVYRDAADTQGPLDILTAQMDQQGPQLVLNLRTADLWTPGQLAEEPGRSVCVTLYAGKESDPRSKVCVVSQANTPMLQLTRYRKDGTAEAPRPIAGSIRRRTLRSLQASFSFKDAKLPLGKFRWQVTTLWAGGVGATACPPAATPVVHCVDNLPDNGTSPGTVSKPLLLGCTYTGPTSVLNGPRTDKVVALTFDDGPSPFTPKILDILKKANVPASFFVIGSQIAGNERFLRREIDEGHTVGNHTWTHIDTSGAGPEVASQLDRTQAGIKKATNFKPCLFRPPYGAKSAASVALTARKGMQSVLWDVDTSDYERPASFDITQRVLNGVKPGSIVLMHDGGGPRDQTLGALPDVIKGLKAKGYRFVTLSKLLGVRDRYA